MYYNDHTPPHFRAEYNGEKALVDIVNIQVIKGALPNRQLRLILAWDVEGNRDVEKYIDIDPFTLYECPSVNQQIA